MKKFFKLFLFVPALLLILNVFIAPIANLAVAADDECGDSISAGVQCFGENAFGQSEAPNLAVVIAGIISSLLILLGLIFVIMILYGGYTWMTSMGQEDKIKKAKSTIANSAIGLVIVILSYALTNFILTALNDTGIFY